MKKFLLSICLIFALGYPAFSLAQETSIDGQTYNLPDAPASSSGSSSGLHLKFPEAYSEQEKNFVGVDKTAATDKVKNTAVSISQTILMFAGGLAVLMIIVGGFQLVAGMGNEEAEGNAKKTIKWALFGLVAIILAWTIVNTVVSVLLSLGGAG